MANKIKLARGTKSKIESVKSDLLDYNIVYSTDTDELGVKKTDGDVEYFSGRTQIDSIVGDIGGALDSILENGGGGSGDGVDLDTLGYMNHAAKIFYDSVKQNQFKNAWEHSLTVDPSEIERNSSSSTQYGTLQYPNGKDNGVIIPESVTSIGEFAFYGWESNNQPLVIPNSVTSIGNSAFSNWYNNKQPLVIPNSVTSIGDSAFSNWYNKHPLVIGNSVTNIGEFAFHSWSANKQPLVIPNSVTNIGRGAFSGWTANNHPLVIPDSVTNIDALAFNNWNNTPYAEIHATTPPTLWYSNFNGSYPIYVPDASLDAYKTAPRWDALASRIFPISEK